MDCEYFEGLIVRLPDGELSEAEMNALLAHIDGCAGCRALFHAIHAVHDELTAPVEAPDTLCSRVMDAIAQETEAKPAQPKQARSAHAKRRRWRYGDLAIMAACAALVVAVLGVSQLTPRYGSSAGSAAVLTAEAGFAPTEAAGTESALPAEEESAPLLGAASPAAENEEASSRSTDTVDTAEAAAVPQETRSATASAAATGAQEADSAAEAPMDAASAPEFTVAAVPDGADVFDPDGLFVGFVPADALDRLFTENDAESLALNGEPDLRMERGGVSYELFILDGVIYWREAGGALYRADMDEAEFSGYLG